MTKVVIEGRQQALHSTFVVVTQHITLGIHPKVTTIYDMIENRFSHSGQAHKQLTTTQRFYDKEIYFEVIRLYRFYLQLQWLYWDTFHKLVFCYNYVSLNTTEKLNKWFAALYGLP